MRTPMFFLFAFLSLECIPPAPPPPVPDFDVEEAACANLEELGCPEGNHSGCVRIIRDANRLLHIDFHPLCIAAAKTKDDVRACGPGVTCDAKRGAH